MVAMEVRVGTKATMTPEPSNHHHPLLKGKMIVFPLLK
jgi:hypothetical protein